MSVITATTTRVRALRAALLTLISAALLVGLVASPAAAQAKPKKPTVDTRPATAVAGQTATLVARVNPRGAETSVYIQYGKSTSYGKRTAAVSAGAGTKAVDLAIPVDGLAANTKYNFRAVATNSLGTARGGNRSFKTTRGLTGVGADSQTTRVTWNTGTVVRGTVDGVKPGGVKVALMRADHPFVLGYRQVATQTTSSAGAYSFDTGPLYAAARFMVVTTDVTPIASSALTIDNRLLHRLFIKTHRRTTDTLAGRVYPIVKNGFATVQRKTPSGRWMKIERIKLRHNEAKNRSTYTVRVSRLTTRSARYRVIVTPRDDRAHLETAAHSVLVKKRR